MNTVFGERELSGAFREKKPIVDGIEAPIECIELILRDDESRNDVCDPHYHDHIEFLCASEECDVMAWIGGERVNFKAGDMLVISSGVPHTFINLAGESRYVCVKVLPEVLYYTENSAYDVKYILPLFGNYTVPYRAYSAEDLRSGEVYDMFSSMISEWRTKRFGYELALKGLMLKIFLWTVRFTYENGAEKDLVGGFDNARLIQRSLDYINENYADINESDAAAEVGLSYSYYSRLFRSVVGKSFNEYLNNVRINASEKLLLSSDMSVTEIAHATGFATSSHFIERFRHQKGSTPKQYRMSWSRMAAEERVKNDIKYKGDLCKNGKKR